MKKKRVTPLDAIRTLYISEELIQGIVLSSKKNEELLRKKLVQELKKAENIPLKKLLTPSLVKDGFKFDNYFNSAWRLKKISLADCGVWPRMGGLPDEATLGSAVDTAKYIQPYIDGKKKVTAKMKRVQYIKKLGNFAEVISEHIPIIVFEGEIIRHNKLTSADQWKRYRHFKYDINDGNHRAVALALAGKKEVLALVGKRRYKNDLLYF